MSWKTAWVKYIIMYELNMLIMYELNNCMQSFGVDAMNVYDATRELTLLQWSETDRPEDCEEVW